MCALNDKSEWARCEGGERAFLREGRSSVSPLQEARMPQKRNLGKVSTVGEKWAPGQGLIK